MFFSVVACVDSLLYKILQKLQHSAKDSFSWGSGRKEKSINRICPDFKKKIKKPVCVKTPLSEKHAYYIFNLIFLTSTLSSYFFLFSPRSLQEVVWFLFFWLAISCRHTASYSPWFHALSSLLCGQKKHKKIPGVSPPPLFYVVCNMHPD